MKVSRCAEHGTARARWRCDGCALKLCDACVEEGHRLIFCRLCGERALPLDSEEPATTPELARRRRRAAAIDPWRVLSYPFRGAGLPLTLGWIVLTLVLRGLAGLPGGGGLAFVGGLAVLVLVPGLLLAVTRTTAEGEDRLPDWPEISRLEERLGEAFSFLVLVAWSLLPLIALLGWTGCGSLGIVGAGGAGWGAHCWAIFTAGLVAAAFLGVAGYAAVSVSGSGWALAHLEWQRRLISNAAPDSVVTIALVVGTFFVGEAAVRLLGAAPGVGPALRWVAEPALGVYWMLLAAHLVGLLLRRHPEITSDL